MGIQDLIPLKSTENIIKISKYAGQQVAVDGHCWIRRGALDCAFEIYRGEETNSYIKYFMNLVQILLSYKIVPIIVFEGQQLPIKRAAADASATFRSAKLREGKALLSKGRTAEANKCFQQAISITPLMVAKVIKELDRHRIQHIVSPYEAAPQLTYMVNSGQVKTVITDRLDALAFGCSNIIYRMGRSGKGIPIASRDICNQVTGTMSPHKFRYMCILSGCDYLAPLPGIGVREAQYIVKECKTYKNILQYIQYQFTEEIAKEYCEKFIKANAAFFYQFVFDITSRTYTRFSPLISGVKLDYLSGLGLSPQNRNILLLKSNNAIHLDDNHIIRDANKENIDPFDQLDPFGFSEFEFDDNPLQDMETLLKKVETVVKLSVPPSSSLTPPPRQPRMFGSRLITSPLQSITNMNSPLSIIKYQSCQKRKSISDDCPDTFTKVKKTLCFGRYIHRKTRYL